MARLRVGGPVPGKKRKPNPWTYSGYPQWNTYEGLGIMSTCTAIHKGRARTTLPGKKSHVHSKRRLAPQNLAHRAHEHGDRVRGHFHALRRLSLMIDTATGKYETSLLREYENRIEALVQLGAVDMVHELARLEKCRGVVRATFTLRRHT